jgi:hypothetical protein
METLNIEMTPKTPLVKFDASNGYLELSGRSIPENTMEFYGPLFDLIDKYALQPQKDTKLKIQLEYFNTSSSKCLLDIFKKLQNIHSSGKSNVIVEWYYEEDDEDMLEAGEDYQTIVKLNFEMIKV